MPRRSLDLFRRLFYVPSIVPSNGRARQLSQGRNAELFFRSGAVSLDSFQTQIQISGNFRRGAALAEQLKISSSRSLKRSTGELATGPRDEASLGEETRSAHLSMVALVGPYCAPSRRSYDSVDSAMVIARASEPAL